MNKKLIFLILPVCLLALGLAFVSCKDEQTDYHLRWSTTTDNSSITLLAATYTSSPYFITGGTSPDWGLAVGSNATTVYTQIMEGSYIWEDRGEVDGSFEQLINFTKNGISAPAALKTAANTYRDSAPLSGTFRDSSRVTLFYITKN